MFDGSHYPIEENVEKTKELVKVCAEKGLSLEAEVGSIGGEEDGVVGMGECADPDECKAIADLGVDMLAAGIGNIHGKYPANWPGLSFETLAAVKEKTGDMPLVLHGGTGIPDDQLAQAFSNGINKINIGTEFFNLNTRLNQEFYAQDFSKADPFGFPEYIQPRLTEYIAGRLELSKIVL